MTERSEQHADPTPHVRPTEQFAPGEPFPDPTAPSAPHAWADPPGVVPPTIAGVDGPQTRPGRLMRAATVAPQADALRPFRAHPSRISSSRRRNLIHDQKVQTG